jgi:3-deoxy-D-arabino-heptulosonate 7-phosphate (DAHP) synthase
MNPRNLKLFLALTLTASAITVALGCKQSARIELPVGYTGAVSIVCDAIGDASTQISIDANGSAEAHTCPAKGASFVILRDGKPVTTEGPIEWQTTGDGIVTAIHFEVR